MRRPEFILAMMAAIAAGLFMTWLVGHWVSFVGNEYLAALIGFPIMLLIGYLYDRRQARRRRPSANRPEDRR
jgi:membrane associated rhomboid family serine protease